MENKISRSLLTSIFLGKFWNSLTFPWLFSFFLNFPDWKCNSLTFPWPGNFFIFQNFFPDRGNPAYGVQQFSSYRYFVYFFYLILYVPVNNFSVMSGSQHTTTVPLRSQLQALNDQKLSYPVHAYQLCILKLSADNFHIQFGPKSGPTKCCVWPETKLLDILIMFLKVFFEKVNFENYLQTTKIHEELFMKNYILPSRQRFKLG